MIIYKFSHNISLTSDEEYLVFHNLFNSAQYSLDHFYSPAICQFENILDKYWFTIHLTIIECYEELYKNSNVSFASDIQSYIEYISVEHQNQKDLVEIQNLRSPNEIYNKLINIKYNILLTPLKKYYLDRMDIINKYIELKSLCQTSSSLNIYQKSLKNLGEIYKCGLSVFYIMECCKYTSRLNDDHKTLKCTNEYNSITKLSQELYNSNKNHIETMFHPSSVESTNSFKTGLGFILSLLNTTKNEVAIQALDNLIENYIKQLPPKGERLILDDPAIIKTNTEILYEILDKYFPEYGEILNICKQ